MVDPLINILRRRSEVLELLGRAWDALYVEYEGGAAPDIGKRREAFIKMMLKEELGLNVVAAPSTERDWDFKLIVNGKERAYTLKTMERLTVIKVAWNGFPSIERARKFEFKHPMLCIIGDRRSKRIDIYVFEVEDLESLKREMGDSMWWIPKRGTNPRGFGLETEAVKNLIEKAKQKGNHVFSKYRGVDVDKIKEEYWRGWYKLMKEMILREA